MLTMSVFLSFVLHVLFPPFLAILAIILCLASIGKSLGIRRIYVKFLLRVFEFARSVAVEHRKLKRKESRTRTFSFGSDSEPDSDEDPSELSQKIGLTNGDAVNGHSETDCPEYYPSGDVSYRRQQILKYGRESRHNVISRRDNLILSPDKPPTLQEEMEETSAQVAVTSSTKKYLSGKTVSASTFQREFELEDVLDYVKTGIGSIIEDEVTQRFDSEELKSWNLLTRTSQSFEFVNMKLTVIWIIGFFVRYFCLLPGRICILTVGLLWMGVAMAFVGAMPNGDMKKWLHYQVYTSCFQILGGALSAVITYHDAENKPKQGICVANHTSPIDVLILACDNAYALVGQRHGGLFGIIQNALERAASHIWFERSEIKDRLLVGKRLKEHVEDPTKLPILIFPEGTCINNTSVMQFKKGSFEVGGTIYPVAIKYDPKFGDAFWNSSKYGMIAYLYMMMTSWAIVCDVWYLPPMKRRDDEDAIVFANRVKAEIARQGGLVDLMWDGNLKRGQVKSEWKAKQQEEFSRRLKVE